MELRLLIVYISLLVEHSVWLYEYDALFVFRLDPEYEIGVKADVVKETYTLAGGLDFGEEITRYWT